MKGKIEWGRELPEERTVWSFQSSPKLERIAFGPKAIASSSSPSFTASMCVTNGTVLFSFRFISATANPASVPGANRRILPEVTQLTSRYCGGGGGGGESTSAIRIWLWLDVVCVQKEKSLSCFQSPKI